MREFEIFLMLCGIAGIADVLFFRGTIGVWLSKYIGIVRTKQ